MLARRWPSVLNASAIGPTAWNLSEVCGTTGIIFYGVSCMVDGSNVGYVTTLTLDMGWGAENATDVLPTLGDYFPLHWTVLNIDYMNLSVETQASLYAPSLASLRL